MIDNLLGSLDYTTKIPLTTKENTELPKFPDLSPVNINSLLTNQQIENKSVSFDDLLKQTNQKYGRAETLGKPYFINKYEYERFINSDKDNNSFFDWKKNPVFKNPLYFDNEELNAKNQSGFRQLINGTSKMLPGALNAFVSGLDPRPGVKDNEFNQWISDWTKELEYTHPNYYTKEQSNSVLKGIVPFTEGSGNFWGDKVLKNAGFTIGAIGSAIAWDAVISATTAGIGAVPATELALGKLITSLEKQFSTVQKVIRGAEGSSILGNTIKSSRIAYEGIKDWSTGQKALNLAKLGYINYVGSNAEASLEGYQGLVDLNEKLIQEFKDKNGRDPEANEYSNIKKIANQMANTRYAMNLPLLMITNAIEFGTLFSPSKIIRTGGVGFGERIGVNEAGQLFQRGWKDFSKLEKAGKIIGSEPVKNFIAEGFQEGAQYSIEKATEDLGFKKFKNPNFRVGLSEYMESQALGIQKTFGDKEGLESMLIGGLTGLITAGGTTAWDKFVSKRSEKEDKIIGENIEQYNQLNSENILNADSFKDYLKAVADRDQINFDGTTTHLILDAQMQQAIKDKNVFAFKALQHDKLFNLISLATKLSKVDALKLKIDQLKDLSVDEFAQQMGIEDLTDEKRVELKANLDDYIDLIKNKVDTISEIIKTVDNGLLNKFDPEKEPAKFNAFNSLKETFAYQLSHIEDIQGRMTEEMDNILSSKVNPLSQSLLNTLTGQEDPDESLIIDDFTKNFISEKGFDLNILNTKYAKGYTQQFNQLASEIATLNMQVETAKAAKLPYSGYASKLADKKKELSNLTTFLEEFNTKIKKFGEASALRKDFMHQEVIDSFKDLTAHVVKYEMNKNLKQSIGLTQADDLVDAIADLHLLNSSLNLFVDKNNKFKTPKGQDEYINEYIKWKSFAENKVQEAVRKSKYETLRRTPEESINQLASEIQTNLSEIESIKAQIEEIDKQLLDEKTTDEEKELLEKRKDELLKQKQELLDENKELEETKKVIEGKSKEDTQEQNTLNTTNNSESEIVERLSEIILPNLGENLFSNINEKINKTKEELQKVNQEVISNNDLLIYLNNKLEFYLQKINNEQIKIDKQLEKLPNTKYSKKQKQERYKELISKHKDLLLAAQDIQNRISEIEKTNNIQKQEIEDLEKKIQYYQSILNTEKTHTVELQQKLATTKSSLEKTNRLIEKTESYIDRLKSLLKEIVKAISNRISILNDFLESQGKNTPKLQEDIAKIKTQLLQDNIDGELFVEFNKLEKDVNDVLDHEEINQELLDKAELLLQTQIEKAIKLQNEIRYLSELFQENLNEVKKENTNPSSPQNKKIVEEIKQEVVEEEKPEVIAEEVKPVPIPVTITRETVIIQTPTPEVEEIPFFGTSRLMQSFYYKLANRTFGNVMIASFHNFLGKLRTFDGVAHKQNLESFLNQNNLQFTVLLAPDELYTPNGDYFDEAYKDKKAPIVALTDKEGNLVKVDKNNNLSDDGNYIVSLLPPVNKDATDLQDFNSTVEKVKNGEKVSVEVDASHAGHFNFLRQPKEFVLTPEILENPNVTLEIPNTKEAREVNGYTLMPGKLYLKIANNRNKSLMFLDVKLNKLSQISINGKSLPKTIYDSVLHIINNVDESLSYKQELDNFLNSILYVTAYKGSPKREPVIVQVNGDFYQFKIDTTSNEPSFTIEKNREVIFELSNTKKDDVATLQNILKFFDLNDTEQGEIKIPILESGKLRFETQDYIDFLVQNANPTVRYELDFSMENPFDFTGGEIYFKTPSKVEETFTQTETPTTEITSNQSEIDKKADIERRKQALRDLMRATDDDIFMLGVEDGTFMGESLLNMNENGDVVLTRYADSEEGLTKGKGKTKNLKDIAGQFGGEQIATSGIEGGAASFANGVVGEYHIPLQELIDLIKSEDVVFAGLGNKEFVLSPHIADKYLTKINGKQINSKYDAEQKESTIDEKTLEGFSSEEDLAKAFGTKPLEQSKNLEELTKEVVKPIKITKEDKFKGLDDEIPKIIKSAKSLPIVQSLNVTNTDIEKVKAIFKGNVNVENLFQIANSDAWATFQQSAITLYKGATRADLFHEAWHHFSQLYLTKDEKVKLYEETRNKVKDLKDKSDLEVEEYIAREFAKFTETGKIEGKFPERKSIFQKIMDFLKSIFSNETDLSLDSLFNNLYKGQINHLAYNTENIMFGKLNSGINDNFNYNDSKLILSGLDALFIQVLEYYKISGSQLSNIENINSVYNSVAKVLKNIYDASFDENEESINPTISINLGRISDNWNDVKKAHYKESVIFNKDRDSYEFDDDGNLVSKEENEDDKKGRNKADFQEASEKSIFDIMDKEVKSLIFTLVDKDKNGNEIVDSIFGLPKLVDFQRYVNIISEKLSNQNTFADVERVLNELSKDYPSMKDLLNSLTINESNEVKHLRVQFIQNMALVKRELYVVLYNEESKTYNIKAAQSNKQNQVENDIKTYFVISPETKFIKKVNGENQITEPIVYENKDEGLDYDLPFIKSLGINLDVLDYLTEQQQIKFVKDFNIVFVVEHLNNYLKENGAIKDIFKALKTKVNGKTQESAFKTLVDYNLTYLPENISSSFLNASGKIENENVMWATFDKDFNALQKAKTIQELIENPNRKFYNPNNLDISSSKIMDLLFDQSGKRTKYKIDIQNYNGLASEKEGVDGKKTKEVFYTEKAIMDISQFMNRNILTTMQLSNKATYFGLELPKKLIEGKYEFEQTMLNYLFDELNIIYQFDQKNPELTKLKKLSDSIGTKGKYNLAIFKDILTSNTQEIIDEYLETGNLSNETQDFVLSQINQFFEIELKKAVDVLQDDLYKIVPSKTSSYFEAKNFKPEEVIKDYIQNQFVMNVELSKLVFGNPYMHKDPYKRIAGATSSKRRLLADKRTLEDFKSVTKETQRSSIMPILLERLKLKSYVLKNQRTSDDELRFISFKDREKMSDSYDNLLSVVTKELKKTKEGTPEHYSLLQKKIAIEKAYSNVNGSDAMGAITMDAWRKFNWLAGRWSTELEKIYQKTIKWDYHNRLLKASKTEEEKTKQLALRNENTITDAEGLAISVMKYQYYGNIKNDSIMEKAFHKYQLMPLIPQLIEGKLWEQHLDRMILEDVDYALFDSADKLEKSKTLDAFYNNADLDNVNVLEDYESYYKEGNTSYNVRTGYLENIGEQVFMENGTDYSLLFGSQVRKLLFNTEDFSDLYDEFRNTIEQLTQIEKDNLYQKSGLNENGQVVDKPKFIQFLLDELDKKVVNSNVKEYLRLTKAGEFAGSLDTNLQRQPIESIVNSVIQSKIVKQKMHGELMVQVSNVGFETFGKKDSLKFYELENGKVRKMEVKVPLSGKFKNLLNLTHSDGRKIETRERLNEMISKGLIDTRAITMVGYRIPTQEHNSIEVMQIQEFLDPISNLIVVPYEITAKAGSDFDIDKLNLFKPHIDENGYYIEQKFNSKIESLDNYLKVKSENDTLIKQIRVEKFNWQHDLVKETDRVKQDIFTKINNLKNDLNFYKGQLSDNILFNAIVYEKNILMSQMHQLFDDYMALNSNQKDIGGEYVYKRGDASYKFKDKLKFTVNKEVKEFLDKSNNTFIKSLFTEYADISEETPIYDVKNKIVNDYNDKLNALLRIAIDLDTRFIDNTLLKNKIQELRGFKQYDSTGTFIGSDGEIQKLYSQFNSVFTNPKTAKIYIKGEMPEELKAIYEKNMGFQFELSEELNKLYFDKNQAFIDMVNFKNSYQNRIIEIFEKVLLSPNNFLNLVTPNSTFMFDEALDDVFKMRYKSNEYYEKGGKLVPNDIKLTKSLIPRYNWFTFIVLGEAGAGLSVAAVGNAFSQLIQKAKVNFTEEYLSQYNLRLPIGDISTRVLKDGQPKATAYSQLINLLVDVANDPRVGYANMGDSVIPIVNLMINFGTPIQDIVYFINQPIIVDYVSYTSKNRKSVVDGEYQEDGFASYLKDKILNHQKTPLKLPEAVSNYLNLTAQELSEKLSDVEFNASKESMGYKLKEVSDMTEKVSQEQLLILAQFAQMEQIAKDFLQLQVTMNFDTSLVQDGFEAYQKEELFKEIKGKDIFTNLDDLREKTVIAPLNVLKEVININAQLLPLANDKVIYNFLSAKLSTEFANKGNKAKKKFVRTFKNDFIMYLFQNFMDRNPDAMLRFNITFAPVLKTKEKDYTNRPIAFGNYLIKNLYKEFADIKNDPKYKDLFKQYLLLDRLFVSSEEEIKNIGLSYFNKDSQLQDTYIEQFKELLNNPDLEIKNFMLKFAYMSFYQSGINKSFISSTDILPVPILSGMLEDVREQYLKEFDTPIKKLNLLGDFYTLLKANNEFLRSGTIDTIIDGKKIKEKAKNKKFNITKKSWYRGKNFRTNVDNLLIQPVTMPIEQSEEEVLQDEGDKIQLYGNVYANKGQISAIQNFREFIHSTNKSFLLKGRGGTGKSTIAGKMLLDAQKEGYYIFGTAISDAATSNLRNLTNNYKSLNIGIYNFASMFGLVPKYDNDGNLTSFDFPSKDTFGFNEPKITDSIKTILVFDEASMVGKDVLEKIKKLLPNSKILYMGDNAQIKPIGQNETISPIFTNSDTTSELTEVMRQGLGSPILEIASNLAKDIDTYDFEDKNTDLPALNKYNFEYFNTKDNSGTLITTDIYKFVEEAVKDFKQYGAKSTIVITGNNDNVEKLNKEIRSKIVSGDDIFVKGERLMTYSKYTKKSKYSDDSIENSSIVYINSARPTEVLGIPAYQLEVSYTNKEGKEMTAYMNVLLKSDKQNASKLFDLKREIFKQLKAKQNVAENRVKADILNQTIVVDYGYAMTAHKVQGQTVRNSYVYPIYRGFNKEESTRMFYTSITRPTDKLVIFDKEGNNQSNLDKFINQQTTEQPTNKEIKPNELQKQNIIPQDFTNHSGGAKGGDMQGWDKIGREFGVNNHNHYTVAYYDKLSTQEKDELDKQYLQTVKFLGRGVISKDTYAGKLVRRDMIQANNGEAIYGVTELVKPTIVGRKGYKNKNTYSIPEGGTGYAVARGILLNKPTYVFNQSDKYGNEIGWYKWDSNTKDFVKTETPTLTKNFTGIGSQEINELGLQAIRDVYQQTLNISQVVDSGIDTSRKIEVVNRYTNTDVKTNPDKIDVVNKLKSEYSFNTEDEAINAVEGIDNENNFTGKGIKTGTIIEIGGKQYSVINDPNKDIDFIPVTKVTQEDIKKLPPCIG